MNHRKRAKRVLINAAAAFGVVVLASLAYGLASGLTPGQSTAAALPKIIDASFADITPREITVIDGSTIRARGRTIRLVGFDAPESGPLARCAREREVSERATAHLRNLVAGGSLELRLVPCGCPAEGTPECNHGRSCGTLTAYGRDVGATLIQYAVARPRACGMASCAPRQPWC